MEHARDIFQTVATHLVSYKDFSEKVNILIYDLNIFSKNDNLEDVKPISIFS